jgi:hypothetical protein
MPFLHIFTKNTKYTKDKMGSKWVCFLGNPCFFGKNAGNWVRFVILTIPHLTPGHFGRLRTGQAPDTKHTKKDNLGI